MVEVMDILNDRMKQDDWEKRSILGEPRLSEAVLLYEEMGFEVIVKEVRPEDIDSVSCCAECGTETMKIIYTRKTNSGTR